MGSLATLMGKWRESWLKLAPFLRRLILGGGLGALVGLSILAAVLSQGPRYAPVFSGLQARDASEIVQKLEAKKIPYRLADNGRAILVPEKDVYQVRLSLASEGLPRGGVVGFELMDQTKFGATEFDRRVNYQRALEGEITRTIMELTQVAEARVHIVLPEPSVFISQKKPATAAILLRLRPGAELVPDQVRGIVHLVSRSVEGLKPEDVTVVDDSGRILSNDLQLDGTNPNGVKTGNNLDLQQRFQRELEVGLQSLLEQVLGRGNVVTRVKAELNFDEKTVEKNLFEPAPDQQKLLRSVQELQETFKGSGSPPGGSANSTVPVYPTGSNATSSDYQKTQSTRNYEVNETREKTVVAQGTLKRLSVAVVVNKDLTPQEQESITKLVSSAIGLDQSRQDQITVTGMAFNNALLEALKAPSPAAAAPTPWRLPKVSPVYMAAGAGVILLLLFLPLLVMARRRRRERKQREEVAQLLQDQLAAAAKEEGKPPEAVESPRDRLREEIERLVKQNPEGVAQVVKAWLAEE